MSSDIRLNEQKNTLKIKQVNPVIKLTQKTPTIVIKESGTPGKPGEDGIDGEYPLIIQPNEPNVEDRDKLWVDTDDDVNPLLPASATNNAIPLYDLTTGKLLKDSGIIGDPTTGRITVPGSSSSTHSAKSFEYDTTLNQWIFYDNDSNTALNLGYENWVIVKNVTGSTIPNGTPVYVTGVNGGVQTVAPAIGSGSGSVSIGLTTQSIANNATGKVTNLGLVRGINTSGLTAGAVYVHPTVAGTLTNTRPTSPYYAYRVGFVGDIHASTGTILVTPSTAALGNGANGQVLSIAAGIQTYVDRVRVGTVASSATPTINTDNVDTFIITAQTVDITSFTTNLTGTPANGQKLWIAITGTGSRAITWGSSFEASTIALPTTTTGTVRLDVGFIWNAVSSKWRCVGVV